MRDKWNSFYQNYGRFYLTAHPNLKTFIHLAKRKNLKKILDLGCGSGRHVLALAKQGFNVFGIDLSPSAAQLAEQWLHKNNLDGEIIVADFEDEIAEYPQNSFDGIIAVNSLEYGPNEQFEKNLQQIKKLLRPHGLFFIVYRSKETPITHPDIEIRFLDNEELRKLISKYFKIIFSDVDTNKNYVYIAENSLKNF